MQENSFLTTEKTGAILQISKEKHACQASLSEKVLPFSNITLGKEVCVLKGAGEPKPD